MLRLAVAAAFCTAAALGAPARDTYAWRKKLRPVLTAEPVIVEPKALAPAPSGDPCAKATAAGKPCPDLTTDMKPEEVEDARAYYIEKHPEGATSAGDTGDAVRGSEEEGFGDEEAPDFVAFLTRFGSQSLMILTLTK